MAPTIGGEQVSNLMLLALPPASLQSIARHFEPVTLERGRVLSRAEELVDRIYFANCGLVSLVKTMRDGRTIEASAMGIDGFTTPEALVDGSYAALDSIVQIGGTALVIERNKLFRAMAKNRALGAIARGYVRVSIERLAQTAACNRLHSLEQRCCRWLLTAHDNVQGDTFVLTHEFLAMMLGVQRPSVSIAASDLQKAGLIDYSRARVTIADRKGLENSACECYSTVQGHLRRLYAASR